MIQYFGLFIFLKRMEDIFEALKQERNKKQSNIIAINARRHSSNKVKHSHEDPEYTINTPPPPGGKNSNLVFPKVFDHNEQEISLPIANGHNKQEISLPIANSLTKCDNETIQVPDNRAVTLVHPAYSESDL